MRSITLTLAVVVASLALAPAASADDGNTQYGAIAWSPSTGATGSTSHYNTLSLARAGAETNCGQNDCYTLVSGPDKNPMAVAVNEHGRVFYNWGDNWPDLRDSLMADCRAYSGTRAGCRIIAALPL